MRWMICAYVAAGCTAVPDRQLTFMGLQQIKFQKGEVFEYDI
jgi:hypothetical protein